MKHSHIYLMLLLAMLLPNMTNQASLAANLNRSYPEVTWEKLIPPNWDPDKFFKGLDLSKLQDGDPRALEAMIKSQKYWEEAPANRSLQGKTIKISGYLVSLDFADDAELKEFLLVPYFGACIHIPPPPANQIIHVTLEKPSKGIRTMDEVTVYGTLAIEKTKNDMGGSGYSMKADAVEPYVEKK